jgi:NAD(P)-dependent dehydrogenase (short-subunit alcohol dehydrogenase family)
MSSTSGSFNPLDAFRLDGRTILITGASSGLGARFARVAHGLGATVVVSARRADRLDSLVKELGERAHAIASDVAAPGANAALVTAAIERTGGLHGVVANAGIANTVPAVKETPEDFARVVHVDLVAPFELAQATMQHWRSTKQAGSIVMVASAAGHLSDRLLPQAGYVAAKTGLVGLTRELALQWGRYGVRVNALCPGMFPSEMTQLVTDTPEVNAAFSAATPMGRLGQEHELDGALSFLLSDASSYMTGQSVIVDGGLNT